MEPHNALPPIWSKPSRLLDLPVELITKIIDDLHLISYLELEAAGKIYVTPDEDDTPMVVTTLQKFASTNRMIYQLCCPVIWRTVACPGSKTNESDTWTDDIFPKHGHHVKVFFLHVYDDSIPLSDELNDDKVYRQHMTSTSRAIEFLARCPNIMSLTISYELSRCEDLSEAVVRTEAFLTRMIPQIVSLKKLSELHIENTNNHRDEITSDFTTKLLEQLPSLEAFRCNKIPAAGPVHDHQTLGLQLSRFKSLKQLALTRTLDISEAWCLYPWAQNITQLEFLRCGNLMIGTAYKIIHHIAPQLTHLGLQCGAYNDFAHTWDPVTRFSLPSLIHLNLDWNAPKLLYSFRECKALRIMTFTPHSFAHFDTVHALVRELTWPNLKDLEVSPYAVTTEAEREEQNFNRFVEELGKFIKMLKTQQIRANLNLPIEVLLPAEDEA